MKELFFQPWLLFFQPWLLEITQEADPTLKALSKDGFGHWLAGFIDGEGCFIIQGKLTSFQPWFRLKLRRDDERIVRIIHARLGFGRVIFKKAGGSSKPAVEFIVQKKLDCLKLVRILDKFPLRAKKHRDYLLWRHAVILSQEIRHYSVKGIGSSPHPHMATIMDIKSKISQIRKYPSEEKSA